MMSFITLIIVISILVFVHELGHFLAAKISGVRVDEFAIGFPPKIWSIKKGETVYSVNLILLGGYVKIFGENPDAESISGPDKERSFINKNRGLQAFILIAGVLMNVLFAWMLLSTSLMFGVNEAVSDPIQADAVLISKVLPDSPALIAGLKNNDVIVAINNEKANSSLLLQTVSASKVIDLSIKRGSEMLDISISPSSGVIEGKSAIGVALVDISNRQYGFVDAVIQGAKSTIEIFLDTFNATIGFIKRIFLFKADLDQVSGPVGIATYLEQAREFGFDTLLMFVAMISINLAVVNLLPFPALDGGRLLFVAIESLIRRSINPKFANTVNIMGFSLLLLLMLFITFSDVGKLVK